MFAGLPLKDEGSSFSPRFFYAAAIAPAQQLQCQCPADPQACPDLAQQMCHPVVEKAIYCPVLVGCLSKENTIKLNCLLKISVWMQPATETKLSACDPNPLLITPCLSFVTLMIKTLFLLIWWILEPPVVFCTVRSSSS